MKRKLVISALILFLFETAMCQSFQISFDSANKITTIDNALNKKYNFFPEYQNLKDATLFQTNDSTFLFTVTYIESDKILKSDKTLHKQELEQLRSDIDQKFAAIIEKPKLDQSGRYLFLAGTTAFGTVYSFMLPSIFDMNNIRSETGVVMLGISSGLLIPYWLTKNEEITYGNAWASIYGQGYGISHGTTLLRTFDESFSMSSSSYYIASVLGGITEGYAAYKYSKWQNMQAGEALAIGHIGLVTSCNAMLAYSAFTDSFRETEFAATYLLSSLGGLAIGQAMTNQYNYSPGDALVMLMTPQLGIAVTGTMLIYLEASDEKVVIPNIALGSTLGLVAGHYMAGKNDFTTGQAIMIGLGEFAGGALGLGTAFILFDIKDNTGVKLMMTTVTAGAITGFALMARTFSERNQTKAEKTKTSAFNFNINPLGIEGLLPVKKMNTQYGFIPAISVGYKF